MPKTAPPTPNHSPVDTSPRETDAARAVVREPSSAEPNSIGLTTSDPCLTTEPVAIVGCGWLGLAVAQRLLQLDTPVIGTTTTTARLQTLRSSGIEAVLLRLEPANSTISAPSDSVPPSGPLARLLSCTRLLFTIPPSGLDSADAYVGTLRELLDRWNLPSLKHVVFVSSTSVYGGALGCMTEESPAQPVTTSASILLAGENFLRERLCGTNCAVSILRSAGQMGFARHPGRFLAGRSGVADPELPVNMVHQVDLAECATQILLRDISAAPREAMTKGPTQSRLESSAPSQAMGAVENSRGLGLFEIFNAASNTHPHREDFYSEAALYLGLPIPEFANQNAASRPGRTISSEKIRRVLGVKFHYDDLMAFVRGKLG